MLTRARSGARTRNGLCADVAPAIGILLATALLSALGCAAGTNVSHHALATSDGDAVAWLTVFRKPHVTDSAGFPMSLTFDGSSLLSLRSGEYMTVEIKPGTYYDISVESVRPVRPDECVRELEVVADSRHFVLIDNRSTDDVRGLLRTYWVHTIDEQQARGLMKEYTEVFPK